MTGHCTTFIYQVNWEELQYHEAIILHQVCLLVPETRRPKMHTFLRMGYWTIDNAVIFIFRSFSLIKTILRRSIKQKEPYGKLPWTGKNLLIERQLWTQLLIQNNPYRSLTAAHTHTLPSDCIPFSSVRYTISQAASSVRAR